MYPISNAVKALFEAEQRQVLRITGTDKNGTAINITDADVVIDSFNIDRFSCIGNKLEIGTATSAQMTVKLDNYDGRFNGIVFEGTELFVEIGIADWTQSNPTINWIPCGYFTPDEQPRSLKIITIHALDRMMRFDATMPTLTPWVTQSGDVMTDSQGNIIYFVSNVQFPVTVQNLVKRVALLCGVPFTQSLSNLPNYSYTLSALPTLQQEITFRNIIQWCAGIMGANAWIDWTGSLRFSWYGATTGYTSTTANRFSSDLNEDNITITGVQYTNTQNVTIVSGTADYTIDLTGNYLAAVGISTILPNIRNKVNGFTYRPFTASVINAPYLWPMDIITFNKDGTNYTSAVTNVNFGINGATALESKGETAQTNSGTAPSGVTKEQGFLIEQAAEATREIEESMNQEGIFNLLTNNGEVQGLFLYNGKIYLNAEYIQTGTLVANLLMAGILTVGGANNGNGQIRILDADGNIIGTWNKNGISVTKGSITGGTINGATLTLGGDNNVSGTLTVKDANGNTIATINNNGVTVNKGSISGPSITLGGANNANGYLYVRDANNNIVATINNDGLALNKGSINLNNNFIVNSNGNVTAKSLIANDYVYVDGGANSYFRIPCDISDFVNNYIEISSSGAIFSNTNSIMRITTAPTAAYGFMRITSRATGDTYGSYFDYNAIYSTMASGYAGLSGGSISVSSPGVGNVFAVNKDWCRIYPPTTFTNSLTVQGTKSRAVITDQYSERLLYCYETPSPMFGDVGEGVIGEDGKCYVWLDPVFAQTITTTQYQVFLQRYGSGECWVSERKGSYFVVQGTPGMAFGWELKAKQRDFDQRRLERNDEPFTVPKQTYGEDAAKHIDELRKERLSA